MQVSRSTPRVEDEGSGLGGYQANTQGEEVEGSGLGGLQADTQGVSRPTPRGMYPSMH